MDQPLKEALNAARKAVECDGNQQYEQALYFYNVAIRQLNVIPLDSTLSLKVIEYQERITTLKKLIDEKNKNLQLKHENKQTVLQRCNFLLSQALDADEANCKDIALKLYTEAAELGLTSKTDDHELKQKLTKLVRMALERAEDLKGIKKSTPTLNNIELSTPNLPSVPETDLSPTFAVKATPGPADRSPRPLHRGSSAHLKVSGGSGTYSADEKRVLLHTSNINNNKFVPFMSVDLAEKFQYAIPFTDKDGLLELDPKQKIDFLKWARPEELFPECKMVMGPYVDYFSIKQTVVSDCSFVASLAVSAKYEKTFKKRLVTSIIYPQNRNHDPIYNPFGKYMVKLHINGIPRKVIIDDQLPIGHHNQLLCSYSNNRGELWISLLEKAYMKVMGGYDFPGSNSNIDLHALTGWIPERWAIRLDDPDFNRDSLFDVLLSRMHQGHVLVTVATGELSDADAERTGLVPSHAYAVLDAKKVKGVQLVQLKNPWSHLRWRGNYSELDMIHWTTELRQALNYDPDSASEFDNGIFWIDYDSICRFFDVFYLNWNPALFKYTYCIHQMWKAGIGPTKDAYNIGDNPQFSLEVAPGSTGAIWILLTRHITDIADFRQNQEYITVLVYRNNGKRVFYPHDPPPYIDGVRINSPHYLCKLKLAANDDSRYTLVISQYEKTNTIYYTLRTYATCPITLRKIAEPYICEKEITDGQWSGISAGGCSNHPATYHNNPRYQLVLENNNNNNHLQVILKGPKQYQIGFEIITVILIDSDCPTAFRSKNSGSFRSGFVVLELEDVPAGTYNIVPSTFLPGQEGPFFLTCKASCNMILTRIQ